MSRRQLDFETANRSIQDGVKTLGNRTIDGEVVEAWGDSNSHPPVFVRVQFAIPGQTAVGEKVSMWQVTSDFKFSGPVVSLRSSSKSAHVVVRNESCNFGKIGQGATRIRRFVRNQIVPRVPEFVM